MSFFSNATQQVKNKLKDNKQNQDTSSPTGLLSDSNPGYSSMAKPPAVPPVPMTPAMTPPPAPGTIDPATGVQTPDNKKTKKPNTLMGFGNVPVNKEL